MPQWRSRQYARRRWSPRSRRRSSASDSCGLSRRRSSSVCTHASTQSGASRCSSLSSDCVDSSNGSQDLTQGPRSRVSSRVCGTVRPALKQLAMHRDGSTLPGTPTMQLPGRRGDKERRQRWRPRIGLHARRNAVHQHALPVAGSAPRQRHGRLERRQGTMQRRTLTSGGVRRDREAHSAQTHELEHTRV